MTNPIPALVASALATALAQAKLLADTVLAIPVSQAKYDSTVLIALIGAISSVITAAISLLIRTRVNKVVESSGKIHDLVDGNLLAYRKLVSALAASDSSLRAQLLRAGIEPDAGEVMRGPVTAAEARAPVPHVMPQAIKDESPEPPESA